MNSYEWEKVSAYLWTPYIILFDPDSIHVPKFQARTIPDHKRTPPVRDPNYVQNLFSKTTSHVFPAISKQGYTDHYLVA